MKKKIKNASFMNWLWFMVYLLPLIFMILNVWLNCNNPNNNISLYNMLADFNFFSENFIFDMFHEFLSEYFYFDDLFSNWLCFFLNWFCLVTILHLAFDLLMLLPNICHKFMERVGGERD